MNGWTVIFPVKPFALAKTRLDLPHWDRERVARGFAHDVLDGIAACAAVDRVIVVTADRSMAGTARGVAGAIVLEDRPLLSDDGLTLAVEQGRRWALQRAPQSPLVVVPADLPCLTESALSSALTEARSHERAFVPDLDAVGSTLVTARRPDLLVTRYGEGSARKHAEGGLTALTRPDVVLRRDVDTSEHLADALRLGVGPATARALATMRPGFRVPVSAP